MMVSSRDWSIGRKGTLDSGRLQPEEDGGGEVRIRCEPMDSRGLRMDSTLSCDFGLD